MSAEKKELLSTAPYRGTRDFYPDDMRTRITIFNTMRRVVQSFGFEEYDGPMLERFELYAAKSGDELVNEQLYHFEDRGGRHVAIRPEMTPTVARMVAARINQLPRPIRWFSIPNLWRYEKPQRGRLREHWQLNVDIFGVDGIMADLEIIEIAIRIMEAFGAGKDDFKIHISNRKMLNHFLRNILGLDQSSAGQVCRAIDKKSKIPPDAFLEMVIAAGLSSRQCDQLEHFMNLNLQTLIACPDYISDGTQDLADLFSNLNRSGLADYCTLDLSIVRGLEYYTGTVFEMYDLHPQNKRALFGGGRYDNLVGIFSDQPISGVGFGMGDVTVQDFLSVHDRIPVTPAPVQVFVALYDKDYTGQSFQLARLCRKSGLRTCTQLDAVKLGKQFKLADALGAAIVVLQGPDEISNNQVTLKRMATSDQVTVPMEDMILTINRWLEFGQIP
jgi:histidyl-tRNA synthetase